MLDFLMTEFFAGLQKPPMAPKKKGKDVEDTSSRQFTTSKPIKLWSEAVAEQEATSSNAQVPLQTSSDISEKIKEIQLWVAGLAQSPETLVALQKASMGPKPLQV